MFTKAVIFARALPVRSILSDGLIRHGRIRCTGCNNNMTLYHVRSLSSQNPQDPVKMDKSIQSPELKEPKKVSADPPPKREAPFPGTVAGVSPLSLEEIDEELKAADNVREKIYWFMEKRRVIHIKKRGGVEALNLDLNEWETVFRHPYITHIRYWVRGKVWATIAAAGLTPPLTYAYFTGVFPWEQYKVFIGVTCLSLTTMYLFGQLFRRFVGIIYVNKDRTKVRFAHLSFFGGRIDTIWPVDKLRPLSETSNPYDWFCPIRRTDDPLQILFVSIKLGGILKDQLFYDIFGIVI